jgi:hypothetical protein
MCTFTRSSKGSWIDWFTAWMAGSFSRPIGGPPRYFIPLAPEFKLSSFAGQQLYKAS